MLEIDDLHRAYGPVRALDGMTFDVPPGSVVGFLGPNGAGKTTTMRAIFGLTELDRGEVRFDGRPLDGPTRRSFGYLPEERGLYANMRILDQLVFVARLHGVDRAAARRRSEEWLERLGLGDRAASNLEDLSLGNQQRVQLISALVHEPEVLILDEPFSGLDPVAVDALSDVLVSEARRGATVLFSSHQLDLVEDLCESAIIVDRGARVAAGPMADLTLGNDPVLAVEVPADPDGAWAAGLDPQRFQLLGAVHGTVRLSVHVDAAGDGVAASAADDADDAAGVNAAALAVAQEALAAALRAGPVNRFGFERRTLAEVFMSLVGRDANIDTAVAPEDVELHTDERALTDATTTEVSQ